MPLPTVPELLAPAGSLDAARAALANGADAIYLGAERFNARDEGAHLSLEELAEACHLARERGSRVYLTLNTLVKPGELADALLLLGECIDRGVDAAIVQDIGLVGLIRKAYPGFELHGSTQMTVHDESGAALMRELGLHRVVLARENTLEDIRAIRTAVPDLELESFIHGALCISYSGQCYMSGMISERSANRGSCAQSCRKDYTLSDSDSGDALDRGYLISARDLAAYDHLAELAAVGVHTLKIEGRKKKPDYVATVTRSYRGFLDRVRAGEPAVPDPEPPRELVQIYSRGFTGGMYGGRAGRDYVTRDQPDNRGIPLGTVIGRERGALVVRLSEALHPGDGIALEPPAGVRDGAALGFTIQAARTLRHAKGSVRQAITPATGAIPRRVEGWSVVRTFELALARRARESYAALSDRSPRQRARVDVRAFGSAGSPLKLLFTAGGETLDVRSEIELVPAVRRPIDQTLLREQLGRLGETPFALGGVDDSGLAHGLFIPVSELNDMRQRAVAELASRRDWALVAAHAEREERVRASISSIAGIGASAR